MINIREILPYGIDHYEKLHSRNRRFRLIRRVTSNCLVYCKIKLFTIKRINRFVNFLTFVLRTKGFHEYVNRQEEKSYANVRCR